MKSPKGYGRIKFHQRALMAPRISWELHHDTAFPVGLVACHHCDNPPCVNPHHIFAGTKADNRTDCVQKERHSRGTKVNTHKLTEEQVRAIRQEYEPRKVTRQQLAARYGVRKNNIDYILSGKTWAWLT